MPQSRKFTEISDNWDALDKKCAQKKKQDGKPFKYVPSPDFCASRVTLVTKSIVQMKQVKSHLPLRFSVNTSFITKLWHWVLSSALSDDIYYFKTLLFTISPNLTSISPFIPWWELPIWSYRETHFSWGVRKLFSLVWPHTAPNQKSIRMGCITIPYSTYLPSLVRTGAIVFELRLSTHLHHFYRFFGGFLTPVTLTFDRGENWWHGKLRQVLMHVTTKFG